MPKAQNRFKERKKAMRFNLIGTLSIQCGTVVTLCILVDSLNKVLSNGMDARLRIFFIIKKSPNIRLLLKMALCRNNFNTMSEK